MRLDRKGDIGFMEAMAGAMTVCLALMAFTSFVAADTLSHEEVVGFDASLLSSLYFEDGVLAIDHEAGFYEFLENNNLSGMQIRAFYDGCDSSFILDSWGEISDCQFVEKHIISIKSGDSLIPVVLEVILYQ